MEMRRYNRKVHKVSVQMMTGGKPIPCEMSDLSSGGVLLKLMSSVRLFQGDHLNFTYLTEKSPYYNLCFGEIVRVHKEHEHTYVAVKLK